jgi:hypothetical protein
VHARISAESAVVREWLQTHQSTLREGLADQQLTLGRLDVADTPSESHEGERRHGDSRGSTRDEEAPRRRRREPSEFAEPFDVVL